MKKIVLVSFSLLLVYVGSLMGYTRRRRGGPSRVKFENSVMNLGQQMGQKFKGQPKPAKSPSLKKKVIVFSSLGGGGHGSVSRGLCDYLGDAYDVEIVNALTTVLSPIDTLGTLTFGKVTSEDLYNFMLRCGWTNCVGKYAETGKSYLNWRHGTMVKLATEFLKERQPDLVISVVPHMNYAFIQACEECDIPFLIITNDLDSSNYIHGLAAPYYKKFKYGIPFEDRVIREKMQAAQIPDDQIVVTGFPLRPEFFTKKKVQKLKKEFDIPEGKPVVMVFMGGAGSQSSYRYVRKLARLQVPMHIIVCLGRNERLKRNIQKILFPEKVTITLIGFTNRIADIMAMSDVLITKPGPNSVCEALQMKVPMILDEANGTIFWEQLNIDFMVSRGFAESLNDYANLESILAKYFVNSTFTDEVKEKMNAFEGELYNEKIRPLVDEMIAMERKTEQAEPTTLLSS